MVYSTRSRARKSEDGSSCTPFDFRDPANRRSLHPRLKGWMANNRRRNPYDCVRLEGTRGASETRRMFKKFAHRRNLNEGCDSVTTHAWKVGGDAARRSEMLCRSAWTAGGKMEKGDVRQLRVAVFTDMHLLLLREKTGNDRAMLNVIRGLALGPHVDAVVLPGDVEQAMYPKSAEDDFGVDPWGRVIGMIRAHFKRIPIIFVPGNHEYWTRFYDADDDDRPTMEDVERYMKRTCRKHGIVYLNDGETFVHRGVAFIGATMWTNLKRNVGKHHGAKHMRDFKNIAVGGRGGGTMTVDDIATIHQRHRRNVMKALKAARRSGLRTVVITHHPPIMHPGCDKKLAKIRERHEEPVTAAQNRKAVELSQAYCSTDLEEHIALADVWAYGHTHDTSAWRVKDTLLVTNGMGRKLSDPNSTFDPNFAFLV